MGECANVIPFIVRFAGIFVVWLSLQLSPLFRLVFVLWWAVKNVVLFLSFLGPFFFSDCFHVSFSKVSRANRVSVLD